MNKSLKNSSKHKVLNKTNKTIPDLTREIELITKTVTEKILKMEKKIRNETRNYRSKFHQHYIKDGRETLRF